MLIRLIIIILLCFFSASAISAGRLLVDDFDNNIQYNASHLNDLGEYTDDDNSIINDIVLSNFLRLSWDSNKETYFYTILEPDAGINISSYNYLGIKLRKKNGDENFYIKLMDIDSLWYKVNQHAIKYFEPVSIDTNNFEFYLIPLNLFPYVNLLKLKQILFNFSVPFASLSYPGSIDIDEIFFISTNYQFSQKMISPLLIADFEDNLWHAKQGGYFATESDTNSLCRAAYSNAVTTNENHTEYGKRSFKFEYNIYDWKYGYAACYFFLAPEDIVYTDISEYKLITFYVKGTRHNPYYKFGMSDKWGNKSENIFYSDTSWREISFNIQEMARHGNIDLENFNVFSFVIKEPKF